MNKLRVVVFREGISTEKKVWVAQVLEHDFATQGDPVKVISPDMVLDQLIDLLDTHQLLAHRLSNNDTCKPVETVPCAPPEYFDLWERSAPRFYAHDPNRERVHEPGKKNPFPEWSLDVRIDPVKYCTSYDPDTDNLTSLYYDLTSRHGLIYSVCGSEAFKLFRHPTKPAGHYRCLAHAEQDHEVFQKIGWICVDVGSFTPIK
jgi:hypothetical protein